MATTTYGSPYVSGSDLVAGWPAASLTVADAIDAAGYYVGRGINTQTASYTGVLTDAGKTVTMSNASATTVTIPPNSSVAYPTGTRINILNLGAGACTPTAGAGVTISGTISALATNQGAAVVKTATNTWSYLPFTSGTPVLTSADVSSTTGSPTITTSGANTIYKFTGSGTIVLGKAGLATILVVGGGGAGGSYYGGGGGGAGGVLASPSAYLLSGTNTITVGAGGAAGVYSAADNGASSVIGGLFVAPGGGLGGGDRTRGRAGGSGGGGASDTSAYTGGSGLSGLGNNGGNGFGSGTNNGGGGGGAGAVGGNALSNAGGAGGAGVASTITGSSVTYGGGGGGGYSSGAAGAGGAGGGGAGGTTTSTAGTANTGGGGGGTGGASGSGAAGGSGIVIISVTT